MSDRKGDNSPSLGESRSKTGKEPEIGHVENLISLRLSTDYGWLAPLSHDKNGEDSLTHEERKQIYAVTGRFYTRSKVNESIEDLVESGSTVEKDNASYADPKKAKSWLVAHFGQLEEDVEDGDLGNIVSTIIRIKAISQMLKMRNVKPPMELYASTEIQAIQSGVQHQHLKLTEELLDSAYFQNEESSDESVGSHILENLKKTTGLMRELTDLRSKLPQLFPRIDL